MSTEPSTPTSRSDFASIFNAALEAYKRRTKIDLASHPLLPTLQSCDSPEAVLAILREQIPAAFSQSQNGSDGLTKSVIPTVNVLYSFSSTLGQGIGLAFSPANAVFVGIGVLLLAAIDGSDSQDKLFELFNHIGRYFRRLEIYTGATPTTPMRDTIIEIMVEMLTILAIATKEVKRGRMKKYIKKLAGNTDIEDSLDKLDKLTQEESRMASAEMLKMTRSAEGVSDRLKVNRNRLRDNFLRWLHPPDPSTNHSVTHDAHHKGTAQWFLEGSIFNEWKYIGSFLWIRGKPGSGKSVLCSSIIQDIMALRNAGKASMAYFYFDFSDVDKQKLRNLLPSLLIQLSALSDSCCDILSRLYSEHDRGEWRPSDRAMVECLKEMLTVEAQGPTYIIMDALDECPITSTTPSPREEVLDFVDELVGLHLPNVHICVTSRPEHDIEAVLKRLNKRPVSLHDESGHQQDIVNYVTSFVRSDQNVQRWREEDKELVIEFLSEKADGMFRWVFCHLEVLRHSSPSSVRLILEEFPESLDETYERILREIIDEWDAHRLMQCLVVAVRPLRVEELAEVLGFGVNEFWKNPGWRWEDQEETVMSACSSLVMIVKDGDSRIVQFSHFSIKDFLTADRLVDPIRHVSRYHILLEDAHTVLAQACLGVLLRLDDRVDRDNIENYPLARYAAQYWPAHARRASSRIRDGMKRLFDADKPQFATWLWIYNEDEGGLTMSTMYHEKRQAVPLYYAARLGFYDLTKHLIAKHPEHVNARGGHEVTSVHVAARQGNVNILTLLLEHGGDVDGRGITGQTPLHRTSENGELEVGRCLLDHGADINVQDHAGWTPLGVATFYGHIEFARMLLRYGASVNVKMVPDESSLHVAADRRNIQAVQLLLEYGAEVRARANRGSTPLHVAAGGSAEMVRLLLEHGAEVGAEDCIGITPLHVAAHHGSIEVVRMLFEHGADINARGNYYIGT